MYLAVSEISKCFCRLLHLVTACYGFIKRKSTKKKITDKIFIFFLFFIPERPDPPTDLELTDQTKRSVVLTWIPGNEYNSHIKSMCVRRSLYI